MQLVNGKVHGFERSFQNIDLVDLFIINCGYSKSDGFFFNNRPQFIPLFFGKLFGIIQQRVKKSTGKITAAACTGPA